MRKIYALLFCLISTAASAQTLVGDGVTDNTPIWNTLVANVCASSDREVHIGKGEFRFASPMAGIPCSLHVQGEGWGISVLKFDYTDISNNGHGYYVVGGIDPYGGGTLRDVSILVGNGQKISFAVHVQAHAETDPTIQSHNPHGFYMENVQIGRDGSGTGPFTGQWIYGIYLDGSLNISPPAGVAPYLRFVRVINVAINAYTTAAGFAYYASGSRWINVDCIAAPNYIYGQYTYGNIYVAGFCPYQEIPPQ